MFERILQEYKFKCKIKKHTVEEKDGTSQTTANKSHRAEDVLEKSISREDASHPHHHRNARNKPDNEHETTASHSRQGITNRPIMMVKGTSNGLTKEQRTPPYQASCSPHTTCPNINAHIRNEEITEAVRIEQLRASKRFKDLANALNGRCITVLTHCEP